jgi:hypothetical protein
MKWEWKSSAKMIIWAFQIWPPFLSAAKERHEKLERTKRTLDELLDTERDSKAALAQLRAELADAKAETEKSRAVPALESIQQRLHALGPCLDSAFALMDKLERVTEGGGAETKKWAFLNSANI